MEEQLDNIVVHVICEDQEYTLNTYPNEYRNLMMLIYDRIYTEGFGECLGMGKCGTCMVEIIGSMHKLSYYDRNEQATLSRAGVEGSEVRLACQILIDETMNGLKVKIQA